MIRPHQIPSSALHSGLRVALLSFAFLLLVSLPASAQIPPACLAQLNSADLIDHDLSFSFCELCDVGTVRVVVDNPFSGPSDLDFANLVIAEDFRLSGLTYVPNSTTLVGVPLPSPVVSEPVVDPFNSSRFIWTIDPSFLLESRIGLGGPPETLTLEFNVRRPALDGEGLVSADRTIEADVAFAPSCAPAETYTTSTGGDELPLNEPIPVVTKTGRNIDAGQGDTSYSNPVYGHAGDNVIWRVEVENTGNAELQDFVFDDTMVPGNFLIDWVCPTEGTASAPAAPACTSQSAVTSVAGITIPPIAAGDSGFAFLVGRVTSSCEDRTNTAENAEWGCTGEGSPGGITTTSTGIPVADSAADLETSADPTVLDVDVFMRGVNGNPDMGTRGRVRLRITNNTGGTIKGGANGIVLDNLLPAEYVVDTTFTPTLTVAPAYGNSYAGIVDTLTWTNQDANPLGNRDQLFQITSLNPRLGFPDQEHMIRHGDVVTVTFEVVLIDPTYYDLVANLDVREEEPGSTPADTDPTETFPISNDIDVTFQELCNPGTDYTRNYIDTDTARPEDLDVDFDGTELSFILTSTGDPLPLTVSLNNRGGHDADDYFLYVTFGEAMNVSAVPAGCSVTSNPPSDGVFVWQFPTPVALPASAEVYSCNRGSIGRNSTQDFQFQVIKNPAIPANFDDDLTFRADVIGEIRLNDGTELTFPPPVARSDGITDRANNYSLDALRARVVGFDLFKTQVGICTENNPPPVGPLDDLIQIGEECEFNVEAGGWFGFDTPGFDYIAVQNVQVDDTLPDGQGYLRSGVSVPPSTLAIAGVTLNTPPGPLAEAPFNWTFNTMVPAERITVREHWFRQNVSTRLLNDPVDTVASPNQHDALSRNVLTSTFQAVFFNPLAGPVGPGGPAGAEETFNLGPGTVGFPRQVHRRVDLTVTEPLLLVTKQVCNETLSLTGIGPLCEPFIKLVNNGDAFDSYVYRIIIENDSSGTVAPRAPAYDVTVTSVTDPSDLLFVAPLGSDLLDNDDDTLIDGLDGAGGIDEGSITDNVTENGTPAQVIESYTQSDALLRIDSGDSVTLYYRVDPDDDVAPLQSLISSATATYDSLEGPNGAQTAPIGNNGEIGGARRYTSDPSSATIQIIPVEVQPKRILRTSNTAIAAPLTTQGVSIGEEIEFELRAEIPVAQLRSFVVRDVLPVGLSCADAPVVNLDAAPYDAAGFVPGGSFTPTCTPTEVVWDFGNQTLTMTPGASSRFSFAVDFIARVDNILANQDTDELRNGGTSTVTTVSYIDELLNPVVLSLDEAVVRVDEPDLDLTKAFSVADVDAGDVPRVTVTVTNNGSATAYNPRILEDLSAVRLTYASDIQGVTPPTEDLLTFGADRPLFAWAPGFAIPSGATVTFSFAVSVDLTAEPLELLDNTIQADWTSLPSQSTALNPTGLIGVNGDAAGMRIGALPNAGDDLNDYEDEVSESVPVRPVALTKTDLDPALEPEIGLHKPFEIEIALPEGTAQAVVLTDDLDSGVVSYVLSDTAAFDITYQFEGIASIAGLAPTEAAFAAVPADGDSGTLTWTIGTVITQSEDDLVASGVTPIIRIRYFGRINNDLVTDSGDTLQNTAQVSYTHGETGLPQLVSDNTDAIAAIEPDLTATKALSNVTVGKAPGDAPEFGDTLQYIVTIPNVGNANAYDVNVVDTLPPEVTLLTSPAPSAAIGGALVLGFTAVPAGSPSGPLVWGRGNGDGTLDVPPTSSLTLTYQVEVTTAVPGGGAIDNEIYVDWTSRADADAFERTGNGCPTITPPDDYCFGPAIASGILPPIPPPDPLLKEITQTTAAIGEAFVYRLTIPSTPYAFGQYDVRITDDLVGTGVNLRLLSVVKVSGSQPWSPVNTGTPQAPVIEDTTTGIDIPAGEQITLDVTVVLEDTPGNTSGLPFTNSANFVYNFIDGDPLSQRPGQAGTSPLMTIVGPDALTVVKSGPASMTLGAPGAFTLNVHNPSSGPAWNVSLTDQLPNPGTGGTCDVAPTIVSVQIFASDGVTPIPPVLAPVTDYTVDFLPDPVCELTLNMLSAAAVIGPDQRLIVNYETQLDFDTPDGASLTNVAGATSWFSADATNPGGADRRSYTEVLDTGSVGVLDHEDAHTVAVALPQLRFEKTVANQTTLENPATSATPGDTLRYRLRVENLAAVAINDFEIQDELDRLNTSPAFEPGTLTIISFPIGAVTTGTNDTGGAAGTGLLNVSGLSLANLGDSLVIEFDVTLAGVIANGTRVTNQSQLLVDDTPILDSDDPGVNGQADPMVPDDEDPTEVPIVSAPTFLLQKRSTDLTGDPNILLAGETLRYTITAENIGTDNATDAQLRDAIPVNTSYVAGSTTLNGVVVADGVGGLAPLSVGIPINAPGDPTAGAMRADAILGNDVATVTFDVVIDPTVIDGTVISNQGFLSAVLGGLVDQPSDDPDTVLVDDPTLDVVGNAPLLFAPKSVVIGTDGGTLGVVDPLDVLHYTITVFNNGAVPATAVTLIDSVPANTTWVMNSLRLNGLPVGVPDGGVSPLAAGIGIQSSDLPGPLPGPAGGVLSPGETAIIEFDLQVILATPSGTLITNQAIVGSTELPNLLTDGDGNPATGPEPTVVVVGDGQQLSITKQVSVVGGGAALAGGQLEYLVRITNVSTVPAQDILITDDLNAPVAAQLSYVPSSATLDGLPVGVALIGTVLTADYGALYGDLAPGASIVLRFRATINAGLAIGTPITNTGVVQWDTPPQTASASVTLAVGGMPGIGLLNGAVWHDTNFDNVFDAGDFVLENWTVELLRNGTPIQSVLSDAAGLWSLGGVAPNALNGDVYQLRFSGPGATTTTATLGLTDSIFTDGRQAISDLIVTAGSNLQDLNLPIDPNGVVYGALGRAPVPGATLTLLAAGSATALPIACFEDAAQQGQVTRSDGFYKFDLNFGNPACLSGSGYAIAVTAPTAFVDGPSAIIPPQSDLTTLPYSVPICTGDAIPGTAQFCEVQLSALAPPLLIPARAAGTDYELHLVFDASAAPGSSQIFNNHIPLDPVLVGNIAITKSTPSRDVSRGDLVPYEITVRNDLAVPIPDLTVIDRFPAGFHYIEGSALVDGVPNEPVMDSAARQLVWTDVGVESASTRSISLILAVGAGVTDGKFTNRAQAVSSLTGSLLSGEANATVLVTPDPTFDCTDVIGKVFDDHDRDGSQDRGERGLPGVRLVTARGLVATTDPHGRFHITCAVVPNPDRGSNFILKLDERSLPTGYRMSTRTAQVKRATAGKALRFNYGASVHRIVGLDLADAAFEPNATTLREQWVPRLERVIEELAKEPAILRLSYVADIEDATLVNRRLAAIKVEIGNRWEQRDLGELEIETEIYWRRGAPNGQSGVQDAFASGLAALTSPFRGGTTRDVPSGEATEQQLPSDQFTEWTQDPERLATDLGDRLEEREVMGQRAETVKLKDVVPPIRFESGAATIPLSSVDALRSVLADMRNLENVRLHLVGHADDQPLRASLAAVYGDNEGLSRERAGEVAEYLQAALSLAPEAISFAYAGDEDPIASNATSGGRAKNRRVAVEVWYDEKREALAFEEVVIPQDIKRVKICRAETLCKMRYREGHERRARIRNLIAPLHLAENTASVPQSFIRQVRQAIDNLSDKQNVTVKLIGYTDDSPLEGRAASIYGTHLAVSKARAHRVARKLQDALKLPTAGIQSDGRGRTFPVAANDTARGRALNRRIEIEFWYDDPLQELPEEPQACPEASDAELITKVYDPPWGRLAPIAIEDGQPQIPDELAGLLQRALSDVADKQNPRLRFVGYTRNERLDRRTATVYGDDIGLSAARARRTLTQLTLNPLLEGAEAEHEGRGYVHSNDVVNGGFLQGETDHVAVQVVYDEPRVLDDRDGIDIKRITRELRPKDPLALNLMHITVDGKPIDDPGRSSSDIQRCTDVALDQADLRFTFDDLTAGPRLSVSSSAGAIGATTPSSSGTATLASTGQVPAVTDADEEAAAAGVAGREGLAFQMYTNYGHFIERSEVRVFEQGQSLQATPLAVLEVGPTGAAHWQPDPEAFTSPVRELAFVLRAYDAEENFDETAPQTLWLIRGEPGNAHAMTKAGTGLPSAPDPLLAGYGESGALRRNISLAGAGSVQVQGNGVPPGHTVWLAGTQIPVDENGSFVADAVLPAGMHTVEVAVLDTAGNGELFLRDLELERQDWFYVGIADVTLSTAKKGGAANALQGDDATFDRGSNVDGRLAFFVKGRFGEDWGLTAQADTREGPVEDLFKDFVDKTPEALFRRLDSDYFQPTFGDDGTVEEGAPTSGKFYVKLNQGDNHAMWGNFKVGYLENELAQVDRGLYGANLHYQTESSTRFGERRLVLDGFAAQQGTVPSREDFRGTGGSLYYLRVQDLLQGSERLRIEVRDKDSGLVTSVVHLRPTLDYDIDYLQGRVLLSEPLSATSSDGLLVRDDGLSGDAVFLVVQYEYTPGIDELDALAAGGQGHYWLNDFVRLGATASRNDDDLSDSSLYAADLILRRTTDSWLKLQFGRSEGILSTATQSADGGFNFLGDGLTSTSAEANGYRADASVGFGDLIAGGRGRLALYAQQLDAGYSAPGLATLSDTTQYGGLLTMPISERLQFEAKADHLDEDLGLETTAAEADLAYQVTLGWRASIGARHERRQDSSTIVPLTQEVGNRTDGILQLDYDSGGRWSAYGFGQGTIAKSGNRDDNQRYGLGGAYRVTDRLAFDAEVSHGDSGPALKIGSSFQETEDTHRYMTYALENERGIDGLHQRRGNFVSGARTRLSDSGSVYVEDRYEHSDGQNGLSRAMGVNLALSERWSVAANWELGTLIERRTNAETDRRAGGASVGYTFDKVQLSAGIEYRDDDTEQLDGSDQNRTTWLFKNNLKVQVTPNWRLLAKLNHSMSDSSEGEFFDGGYTEAVLGYAFRPVDNDRLNALAKYTWFSNMPTTDQVTSQGSAASVLQRSHVASLDASYDVTNHWSVGGKYAFRRGEVSLMREDPDFFSNDAHLAILRTDYRFLKHWEALVEGRVLELPDLDERRAGALLSVNRYLGDHLKVGVGYNFTDFSDDLTDLNYDHHGFFFNFVGSL